jgi:chaperonin GroEL (HSP60 family)
LTIISFVVADKFRSDLMNIAMTTLSSKILSQDKEYFAELAVNAVLRLKVFQFLPYSCYL